MQNSFVISWVPNLTGLPVKLTLPKGMLRSFARSSILAFCLIKFLRSKSKVPRLPPSPFKFLSMVWYLSSNVFFKPKFISSVNGETLTSWSGVILSRLRSAPSDKGWSNCKLNLPSGKASFILSLTLKKAFNLFKDLS